MDFEEEYQKRLKENEKYLKEFKKELKSNGFTDRTINNHINNVDLYLNDFINYYEAQDLKGGCYKISEFLGDYFIRKCMWSTPATIKTTAASIKKFYKCMLNNKHITNEDYDNLSFIIKSEMDIWQDRCFNYNSEDYDIEDVFDF